MDNSNQNDKLIDEINNLINEGREENKYREYKQEIKIDDDFVSSITAFANSSGGSLYIGVKTGRDANGQSNGIPIEILGIELKEDINNFMLKIDNFLNDKIEPRLTGIQKAYAEIAGKYLIKITILKSYKTPHMIKKGKDRSQFFFRTDTGKFPMDFTQIRTSMVGSIELANSIKEFRIERVGKIKAGETPVLIEMSDYIVLHVIPMSSNDVDARNTITDLRNIFKNITPFIDKEEESKYYKERYNLDGFVKYMPPKKGVTDLYHQIFRDGSIEVVRAGILNYCNNLNPHYAYKLAKKAILQLTECYRLKFYGTPLFISLSLVNIKHLPLNYGDSYKTDRDPLLIPEVYVENIMPDDKITDQLFDILWQCFGYDKRYDYHGP